MLFEGHLPLSPTDKIPTLDYQLDYSDSKKSTQRLLLSLFEQPKNLKISVFQGGLTNKLLRATFDDSTVNKVVLIRIYGNNTELLVNRESEKRNMLLLSKMGFGPQLYACFDNGMIYEYIEGRPFEKNDVLDSEKSQLVAAHLAEWHLLNLGKREPWVFSTCQDWMSLLPRYYDDAVLPGWNLDRLNREYYELKKELLKLESIVVFCHNDVQIGNIIYNSESKSLKFIDYEYGDFNYRGFDIGNHFCEFAATDLNWNKYPAKEFRMNWYLVYLSKFLDREPSLFELHKLEKEVLGFSLLSHFIWAIWGLIQVKLSDIEFDYFGYSESRLQEYLDRKQEFLCSTQEQI